MTLVELLAHFVGYPQTDVEWLLFMLLSYVFLIITMLGILDLFFLIASSLTGGRR